jgi:poly-gamma-glutamate synthesis protein (capsule biosynthesis protein)
LPQQSEPEQPAAAGQADQLTLVFGGDIMAHRPNFTMKQYSLIWEDLSALLQKSDLAFANLEFPIDDSMPYASYPKFNVHHEYADAAVEAGFNVFSLANNHTTDLAVQGIEGTLHWARETEQRTRNSMRPVYLSGLKYHSKDPLSYAVIKVRNWTILFCAVTQILNSKSGSAFVNYFPDKPGQTAVLTAKLRQLRKENPCDLFIVSVHSDCAEYDPAVSKSEREFCHTLLQNDVNIVWANHPHVVKPWEIVKNNSGDTTCRVIMYAEGNTISAQRVHPDFKDPSDEQDNTGDGILLRVICTRNKDSGTPALSSVSPIPITTYIDPSWNFVVRILDDNFIKSLKRAGLRAWAAYLAQRKLVTEHDAKGITTWH